VKSSQVPIKTGQIDSKASKILGKKPPKHGSPILWWYTLTYFQLHPPKTNMVHLKMKVFGRGDFY